MENKKKVVQVNVIRVDKLYVNNKKINTIFHLNKSRRPFFPPKIASNKWAVKLVKKLAPSVPFNQSKNEVNMLISF